ncbi:MAG TPA: alpha/beta hydrolase [Stellaceae bacterium]|nr:alpha/beta hydrolase [Stellaceae bacterium]
MSLHPAVAAWLEPLKKLPPTHTLPVEVVRANMIAVRAMMPPPPAVGHVADRKLPGPRGDIPVRLYTPFGIGPFPLTIYFHGGGFVLGNLDSHDSACRHLCLNSNSIVMAVDYRLAPEHPFPAAPDDCYAATVWAGQHAGEIGADGKRFAVSGDSAGGNLAAVVSLRVRDEGGPRLCGQLLNCPVTDYDMERPSYTANADGYFLTRETMKWFDGHYLKRPEDRKHPHAAPIRALDFTRLPPAYVLTAQYDPLCDEGEEYADKLAAAGVAVVKKRYSNMIHAFPGVLLNIVPEAAEELRAFGAWLQARFASV